MNFFRKKPETVLEFEKYGKIFMAVQELLDKNLVEISADEKTVYLYTELVNSKTAKNWFTNFTAFLHNTQKEFKNTKVIHFCCKDTCQLLGSYDSGEVKVFI